MDYFKILNFSKEPFSNSPSPEFLFESREHVGCLQKLELAVRLRRGLNIVIGNVGTGKTTLCRQLIRKFGDSDDIQTHLLLDPSFDNSLEFLSVVAAMLGAEKPKDNASEWQFRESIKKYLFRLGVSENKVIVLIIDEGQKLPAFCVEILREFLNYEVNEYKLLQIIIFAQKEFQQIIKKHDNFADRINTNIVLTPFDFRETKRMIEFRLKTASERNEAPALFSYFALRAVHSATDGYPRKIINLCHQVILALIIQNKNKADWRLVRFCAQRIAYKKEKKRSVAIPVVLISLIIVVLVAGISVKHFKVFPLLKTENQRVVLTKSIPARHVQNSNTLLDEKTSFKTQNNNEILESNTAINKKEKRSNTFKVRTSNSADYPDVLGYVNIKKNETILDVIHKVYGCPTPAYVDLIASVVALHNPQIDNLNTVYIGNIVNLPAVSIPFHYLSSKGWWVQVADKSTLEEAYEFTKIYTQYPLRIFSYRNKREGMKFTVLIRHYFTDEEITYSILNKLPEEIFSKAKIVDAWDSDTVFFSNIPRGFHPKFRAMGSN